MLKRLMMILLLCSCSHSHLSEKEFGNEIRKFFIDKSTKMQRCDRQLEVRNPSLQKMKIKEILLKFSIEETGKVSQFDIEPRHGYKIDSEFRNCIGSIYLQEIFPTTGKGILEIRQPFRFHWKNQPKPN